MKIVTSLLLLCVVLSAQVVPHTPHYPHTSNGTVLYGAMGVVAPLYWSSINTWFSQRFDWVIGGPTLGDTDTGDPRGAYPNKVYWSAYIDAAVLPVTDLYDVQTFAVNNSYVLEGLLLHTSRDLNYTSPYTSDMQRFDAFEKMVSGNYVGGVFTYAAATYADVTGATWSGSPNTTISDTVYVGYMEPFDQINVTIETARVGGSVAYEYWNGSAWSAITLESDGTSGLTATGQVHWHPPANWAARTLTVNVTTPTPITTTNSKYWVRVVVTGASTPPVYSRMYGDDWAVASAGNNLRGWDSTDPNIINTGRLAYNPTPPANAKATFKYHSRVPVGKYVHGNPADEQNGTRTWGHYLCDFWDRMRTTWGYDSGFLDDGEREPVGGVNEHMEVATTAAWDVEWTATYTEMIARQKAAHGNAYALTINGFIPSSTGTYPIGDMSLGEAWWSSPTSANLYPNYSTLWYNRALPANNPNSVKYYLQCFDYYMLSTGYTWYPGDPGITTTHFGMENGNRTPMNCLAQHYLGAHSLTGFMYSGGPAGINGYYTTDQVYTYATATTLSAPVTADTTTAEKSVSLTSNSGCGAGIVRINSQDVVNGFFGRVLRQGTDESAAFQSGLNPKLANGWPSQIHAGADAKFTSLDIVFATPLTLWGEYRLEIEYWNGSEWATLAATDGTNSWTQNGSITFAAPANWATTTVSSVSAYWVRMTTYYTTPPSFYSVRSTDWKTLTTTRKIYNSYSAGDAVRCVEEKHLSTLSNDPVVEDVFAWTRWFPAMATDLGIPDWAGLNGGARMVETPWKTGGAPDNISGQGTCGASDCADLWRRDFTKAIVLFRPWKSTILESELDTPSQPVALGGTYYPLKADGTRGAGITTITLRGGEGAILMKSAVDVPSMTSAAGVRCVGCVVR